eukprot:scaffold292817_cov22-Tisochrysis_lutea.AAC.1
MLVTQTHDCMSTYGSLQAPDTRDYEGLARRPAACKYLIQGVTRGDMQTTSLAAPHNIQPFKKRDGEERGGMGREGPCICTSTSGV